VLLVLEPFLVMTQPSGGVQLDGGCSGDGGFAQLSRWA
jgi:hypothetical protein